MNQNKFVMLGIVVIAILSTSKVAAIPEVDAAADKLCRGFEETLEGVWMDVKGNDVLRFRYATNTDGTGCYAWLNPVPSWDIDAPGAMSMTKVKIRGGKRRWLHRGRGLTISVDIDAGTALYKWSNQKTRGRLLQE